MPAPTAKKNREWKIEEKRFTTFQKSIIIVLVSFIPFFLFVILPYAVRNHIIINLKLNADIILAEPEHVALVAAEDVPPTLRIVMHKFIFQIPKIYTPVQVLPDLAVFRINPRRISRTISIAALNRPPQLAWQMSSILNWFVPNDQLAFFDRVLHATYHPIRMLCKAHFFIGEGISDKIFETNWDSKHRAYIFPTSGNTGYIGRIYNINGKEYYEFVMKDEVNRVTLREWMNLAVKMKPLADDEASKEKAATSETSLSQILKHIENGNEELNKALEFSLNRYYATNDNCWLIPVATVMEKRGYYSELVNFYREHAKKAQNDPQQQALWQALFDRTLPYIFCVDVDPHLNQNQIDFYCKNNSEYMIRNVKLKVSVSESHKDKTFETTLFTNESIHPKSEKVISISPPSSIVVRGAQSVAAQVLDLEMLD